MTALQDQQRLAHRSPAHFQLTGYPQFLNPVSRQHFPTDDLAGQVSGDLFGKALAGFKGHDRRIV
ncbi:hypothetical protein GCM10007426_19750 [Alloalcanivorax dieselolei]|nr:hypothetical protein GCM10007426_19750 [Alloalcanivorax dieselolei]